MVQATQTLGQFTRSHVAQNLFWLDGKRYSLYDYPFITAALDTAAPEVLLKTSRQVSKTQHEGAEVLLENGSCKQLRDILVGDRVVTLTDDGAHFSVGTVTWKSRRYKKHCLRVTTKRGNSTIIAKTHPLRCWDRWVSGEELFPGRRIAAVRHAGNFGRRTITPSLLEFLALMLGDGMCGDASGNLVFTAHKRSILHSHFIKLAARRYWKIRVRPVRKSRSIHLSSSRKNEPRQFLESLEVYGLRSAQKFIPNIIFSLTKQQTALFLNRLWATDGWATWQKRREQYNVGYSSISKKLVLGVQQLLWKFGIPTTLQKHKPRAYRKTRKWAYKLILLGQESVRVFVNEIGALGKTEKLRVPKKGMHNSHDSYPKDIEKLIKAISMSAGTTWEQRRALGHKTLWNYRLHRKLPRTITRQQLQKYVTCFRSSARYDQSLTDCLAAHLSTDIYWDTIKHLRGVGMRWCYDISVSPGESFVADGLVSHNSTTCACRMLANSIIHPHFRTLYVAPLREQTSRFSNTRLSKIIHYSPLVRRNYVDTSLPNNVLLQILRNGSEMSLSYAWDDPDRVRSITADAEFIDEVQDILYEAVIPVIKECMSNSDYGHMLYSGTPKSMENTIEYLWQQSTKSEWIMQCEGCKSWQFVDSVKSIGKHGVICIKCGHDINPRTGKWYDFNPTAKIRGYHVSQPMLPRNTEMPTRWERILAKRETYSETKFKNEVLGISDAIGSRFISQEELVALCSDYYIDRSVNPHVMHNVRMVAAGVDWAGNGEGYTSRTVVWIWGLMPDFKLKTLYYQIFPEANSVQDVQAVVQILEDFGVRYVIGDAGEGAVANSMLRDQLGAHRVGQAQYGGGAGFNKLIGWNKQGNKYLVNRTAAIDSFMVQLKKQAVIYPNARQMATPISDILAEYETTVNAPGGVGKKTWLHAPTQPDDCLHAQIFGWFAVKVLQGDIELYEREIED